MSPLWAWLLLPITLSGAFGLLAPRWARRLPPHVGGWLLSLGAVVVAAASSASIALTAFLSMAQTPVLVAQGHWSRHVLRVHDRGAASAGVLAGVVVALFSVRFLRVAVRRAAAVRAAHRLAAALPHRGAELVVADSGERQAFAVPGRPGRIVATTALLRSLDGPQRRALLAHERAHLRHRHHWHQSAVALAVSINPLLARLPAALALACERWADEDAAQLCRRGAVADAVTRAAIGRRPATPEVVLAAAAADVAARVGALRDPAPRLTLWRVAALAGLALAAALTAALAMHDVDQLVELAQAAYRAGQP